MGCCGVNSESGIGAKRMIPEADFVLVFSSQGGFGEVVVEIDVKRSRDNPVSVVTRIGKNQSVGKVYPQNDPLVEKIAAIMASGVFDLPTENRKAERAGKDLAQVKIVYRDGHSGKTIIRDYRWGETFESSFHEAEKLFAEIVKMVGSAKP